MLGELRLGEFGLLRSGRFLEKVFGGLGSI